MTLKAVVLPALLGPIRPTIWPPGTSSETLPRATIPPNRRRSAARAGPSAGGAYSAGRPVAKEPRPAGKGATLRCVSDLAAELHMSRSQKITNLLGVTIPFAGFLARSSSSGAATSPGATWTIFAVGYALTTLDPIGFHRPSPIVPTRRSGASATARCSARWRCRAPDPAGSRTTASTTASPTREGDPHSPHAGFGPGCAASSPASGTPTSAGSSATSVAPRTKYAEDLLADRGMVFVSRWFGLWVALSLLLPFLAGVGLGRHLSRPAGDVLGRPDPDLPAPPSPGRSTPSATSSPAPLPRQGRVAQRLVALLISPASRGTTTTTPSPPPPSTASVAGARHRRPRDQVMRRLGLVWKVNVPTAEMQARRLDALS